MRDACGRMDLKDRQRVVPWYYHSQMHRHCSSNAYLLDECCWTSHISVMLLLSSSLSDCASRAEHVDRHIQAALHGLSSLQLGEGREKFHEASECHAADTLMSHCVQLCHSAQSIEIDRAQVRPWGARQATCNASHICSYKTRIQLCTPQLAAVAGDCSGSEGTL